MGRVTPIWYRACRAWHPSHRRSQAGALRAFIAATLLCGVSLADEAPIKGSAEFFDQYCSECHYEDQSGGLDLSELTFEPGNRDNFATWVRVFDRLAAGEMPPKKSKGTPRAGGPRDVHPQRFIFSHRLREGSHGAGRPRNPAPAEPLRIRERASRSAERPVGAGEGQAAPRRRSVSFQQERRGARRILRADGALPDRGGLRDAPGDVGGVRTAGEVGAEDLRARRDRAALSAAREWHAARPAHVSRARLARAARGARRTRAQFQPGDARARGRGQGFQHLQRCRSVRLGLQRARRRALPHPAEGLLGLGERRRNRTLVLRGPGRRRRRRSTGCRSGTGPTRTKSGPAATTSPSESTRRARARRGPSVSWTSRRSRPSARSRCNSRAARASAPTRCGSSARASTAPTSSTSIRWRRKEGMPGYAVQWLEVTGPLEDAHATSGYKLLFGDLPMRRLGAGEKGGVPLEAVAPNSSPPVGGPPARRPIWRWWARADSCAAPSAT